MRVENRANPSCRCSSVWLCTIHWCAVLDSDQTRFMIWFGYRLCQSAGIRTRGNLGRTTQRCAQRECRVWNDHPDSGSSSAFMKMRVQAGFQALSGGEEAVGSNQVGPGLAMRMADFAPVRSPSLPPLPPHSATHTVCAGIASLPMKLGCSDLISACWTANAACWASWADANQIIDEPLPVVARATVEGIRGPSQLAELQRGMGRRQFRTW